jgi:hypothetical protein
MNHSSQQASPDLRGGRGVIVAASLANICLLKIWSLLLERGVFIPRDDYIAAFLNLAFLTGAIWTALRVARRRAGGPPLWLRSLLALLLLVALHGFLTILFLNSLHLRLRDSAYLVAVALAIAVLVSKAMARGLVKFLVLASPFVLMTVGQSAWLTYKSRPPAEAPALAPRLPLKAGAPRVVWAVFDTWDYGLSYPDRDPSLRLVNLDRIEREALFAEDAASPGPETSLSVPVLLGNTQDTMGTVPNLFSRARAHGADPGVVGWYLPYCNEFCPALAACVSFERSTDRNSMGTGVLEIARNQGRILLEAEFRSPLGQLLATEAHARVFREWDAAARKMAADPGLSLVFLHAPIPHEPFFFDRATGRDDAGNTFLGGLAGLKYRRYLDALELMDQTIGGLRQSMEAAGLWESTAVLLTSDHPYAMRERVDGKPINPRVPFIVKLPGQKEGARYAPHFETAHAGDLALAILSGEVRTSGELVRWLEGHADPLKGANSKASGL